MSHHYSGLTSASRTAMAASTSAIRQFAVGTGGTTLGASGAIEANGRARNASTHGVLRLTLNADNYAWKFVPVAGRTFADSGTISCH